MFDATFFDGQSSRAYPVTVTVEGDELHICQDIQEGVPAVYAISTCRFEPALGSSRRLIKCPDGALLETRDAGAIAGIEAAFQINRPMRFIHKLESAWKFVALSSVAMLVFIWVFTTYGLPVLARQAAYATPLSVTKGVSERALGLLDDAYLQSSRLSEAQQLELRQAFEGLVAAIGDVQGYRLEFRSGGELGANALALPSGIIVMTDELIDMAERDEELLAVLAHEIGHVEMRHGLRSVYQGTGVFFLVSVVLGNVTSATSVAASLPAVLLDSGYSRRFEREADRFAAKYLLAEGLGTVPLQSILTQLEASQGGSGEAGFLSSHPSTNRRLELLKQLEETFGN